MAEVSECAGVLDAWEARRDEAKAEHAKLLERVGEDVLADPSSADSLNAELQRLSGAAEVADRTAAAARPRLDAARVAVLEFDASELDRQAAGIAKRLAAHRARTTELLALLAEHEGEFVPAAQVDLARASAELSVLSTGTILVSGRPLRSLAMEAEIAVLETKAQILRDVVAGVDPEVGLRVSSSVVDGTVHGLAREDLYPPAVWGPDAVIAAPLYARRHPAGA